MREAMLAAPPGANQALLVAIYHVEQMMEVRPYSAQSRFDYMNRPDVREELFDAARRSIGDPRFRRAYGWVQVAGTFAYVFYEMKERAAAA